MMYDRFLSHLPLPLMDFTLSIIFHSNSNGLLMDLPLSCFKSVLPSARSACSAIINLPIIPINLPVKQLLVPFPKNCTLPFQLLLPNRIFCTCIKGAGGSNKGSSVLAANTVSSLCAPPPRSSSRTDSHAHHRYTREHQARPTVQ